MEKKRKFLFVSLTGLVGDIAWQVLKEGHEVRYFIGDKEEKDIADGFVPKTEDWEKDVDWADVIVFDDTLGQGEKAVALRQRGKAVVGGTPYTDRLEDDRSFGQEELKKAGVTIIPYRDFDNFDDAITYVQENPTRYVIKPSGAAGNVKRRLFVGDEEDGQDVVRMLEAYKKAFSDEIKVFQLQKRVVGVEVAVGAFFNGKSYVHPINTNFEHKKLFPGNSGPPTGEMGTTMFWSEPNKIFEQTLLKMEPQLAAEGYVGYIDVNCIVNNNGIYPLEFTSRFGYPTIFIQQEGMITPIGLFLDDLAHGRDPKLKVKSGFQVGVRIVMPPFPFDDDATFESFTKNAVIVFKKGTPEEVHIEDTKIVEGQWLVAGTSGVVLTVVGLGQTMKQAREQAYARVRNILIPNMYYRDDIGERWAEDSDKLHNWGYLR
ncbi:MAG TPA: phosphoribosylglycinamide synthetase C domain-containing protein [Thermoanaerobaculia bacterium]|jgi:phosphoribosylamine--glycine ligase|nr:phosphoribosylglycinamide synthetase C domain-containing protein [Thermoanaerobaculia bacterium]